MARSEALIPVVTPSLASIASVKAVPWTEVLIGGHQREIQFVATLFGEREADQPTAELGHEVDGVGRNLLGGHGQVAFVFAVFVVDEEIMRRCVFLRLLVRLCRTR